MFTEEQVTVTANQRYCLQIWVVAGVIIKITTKIAAEVITEVTMEITTEVTAKVIGRMELKPNYNSGNL